MTGVPGEGAAHIMAARKEKRERRSHESNHLLQRRTYNDFIFTHLAPHLKGPPPPNNTMTWRPSLQHMAFGGHLFKP
jgi:hypothetical protein